ncbi:magnesium transporter CorA family protein [Aliihoeflea sp. PC F10.4]
MIRAYALRDGLLVPVDPQGEARDTAVWVDMVAPTDAEEAIVEEWFGINVPTRDEMGEIEISSRLYTENGAVFMTAIIAANTQRERPAAGPVTFILTNRRLLTVRYVEPSSFTLFAERGARVQLGCENATGIFFALLEAIVGRAADVLENVGGDIGELSERIFHPAATKASRRDRDFQAILRRIGRKEELLASLQESFHTLQRLVSYWVHMSDQEKAGRNRARSLTRDLAALSDYAERLSNKITFLLDATLGMISIEQNTIIKIVSVAATIFLPPTLVASIYGMNFEIMPELEWPYGYPLALLVMVAAAALPFWYIKKKGWL